MRAGPTAEPEPAQKRIMSLAMAGFVLLLVLPGLDRRYGWSQVPDGLALLGEALVLLGFLVFFLVVRVNRYSAATVRVEQDQQVVSTGPYAVVRHPMYSGAALMMIGTPISLGSWWGLPASLALTVAIIWRLFEEERTLARDLDGYSAYLRKVRWRLIPGVF